jgi:hypothetical protein
MATGHLARIEKISKDIEQHQTIPWKYRSTLKERLITMGKALPLRQSRRETRRPRKEIRQFYVQKRAQAVYLEVLDGAPQHFLPFILAVSPKDCEGFHALEFCQSHKDEHRSPLISNVKTLIEDIARDSGINQSLHEKLVEQLFKCSPSNCTPKPITAAESDERYSYRAADINRIRVIFGDEVSDAIESAPIRLRERAKTQMLQVTECVRTSFPRHNFQDAIISLDIGPARELSRALFPRVIHFTATRPNERADRIEEAPMQIRTMSERENDSPHSGLEEDCDYFTIEGASISAVKSIFYPPIYDAIEKSQLRTWEKKHLLLERTDCVKMDISLKKPYYGTIHLRVEFLDGIGIVKDLYEVHASNDTISSISL